MTTGPRKLSAVDDGDRILAAISRSDQPRLVWAGTRTPERIEPTDRLVAAEVFLVADDHIRVTIGGGPTERRVSFEFTGDPTVFVLGDHHQICAECGELWPCRSLRTDQTTRAFAAEIATLPEVTP